MLKLMDSNTSFGQVIEAYLENKAPQLASDVFEINN